MVVVEQDQTGRNVHRPLQGISGRAQDDHVGRVLTHLVRRVTVLEARAAAESMPRSWALRLRILEAIWDHRGHVTRACEAIGLDRPQAYYHRRACPLFKACRIAVVRAAKSSARDGKSWGHFWAAELDECLRERLAEARVPLVVPGHYAVTEGK